MDIIFQLLAMLWAKLPFIGVAVSFIFKEEIQAWWKGLRSKYINNTYAGSLHYMKSHNFGVGEYVRVDSEKARGKGAGCHITYINSGRRACLPWAVYAQYEFQELTQLERKTCELVIAYNKKSVYGRWLTAEKELLQLKLQAEELQAKTEDSKEVDND